jgi:hypothetical protein
MKHQYFRYVRHENIADYERLGWLVVAELHPPHGQYSVLMQWLCDCPVPAVWPSNRPRKAVGAFSRAAGHRMADRRQIEPVDAQRDLL